MMHQQLADKFNWVAGIIIAIVILGFFVSSCSPQGCARHLGGTATTEIPAGNKLVNVTWKDSQMWILTKPMTSNDIAETYKFSERSLLGLIQGTVVIKETK